MKLIDTQHPFYQPLWRRIAIVIAVAVWAGIELLLGGNPIWLTIAGALLVYTVWIFLIAWPASN
jgi:hypothetical protein